MTAMHRPLDLSPEHAIGRKTPSEWAAIARAHVAGLDHSTFTAAQDLALCEGLWAGYRLDVIAAEMNITPMDALRRFRYIIAPMQLRYSWREVFPIDAQTALLAALRDATPSRHPAGSPIPMDGATRTEPGFDAGRPAPLAASAPDTVAGAANLSHTGEPQ